MIRIAALGMAYAAVTAVMVSPFINYSALASATYDGDTRLIVWTLAWDNHAILSGLPLFDSNIFYPAPGSLAYTEHLFGLSLFTLPVYAVTRNPVLAYNIVWLASFLLSALAAHLLLKRHVRSDLGAFAGALVFTFSFYKMLHAHGHLQQIWTWPLPLSLLLLDRWSERPRPDRAFLWGGMVLLQALTSWYLAVMTIVAQAIALISYVPGWIRAGRLRQTWQLPAAGLFAGALLLPFAFPYRALPASPPEEVSRYSADAVAYLMPPENTWVGQLWIEHIGRGPRWIWGETTLFIGWIALALAALGVIELARRQEWRLLGAYLSLTVAAVGLSLGPAPSGEYWRPFSLIAWLPGIGSLRTPSRFALLVILGVSLLAASGAASLSTSPARRRLLLGLLPLMLSEWFVIGFPGGKPRPFPVPLIYRLEAVRTARALVSLPDYRGGHGWYRNADYLYFSTAHWRPIVNGFGRAEPPRHAHVVSHMQAFPGPNNARTMRQLGVEYVVLHTDRIPGGAADVLEEAMRSGEYDLVARVGADYLFRVRSEG